MMEIKKIMRYLKGIEDYGLWYKLGGNLDLKVFTDANWARSRSRVCGSSSKLF